jgi:hypothetical protein
MEAGKDYEEKLSTFPEEEEYREEKATHLQMKETNSKVAHLSRAYRDLQTAVSEKLYM